MTIELHNLKPAAGSRKKEKRIGRGNASGHGTYSTRGQKGQRARSGGRKGLKLLGFKKILQATPKRGGFRSLQLKPEVVNLDILDKKFNGNDKVEPKILLARGLVREIKNGVKILGNGEITKKLIIAGCLISKSAKEKVEKAGGKVII